MMSFRKLARTSDYLLKVVFPLHLMVGLVTVAAGWLADLLIFQSHKAAGVCTTITVSSLCGLATLIFGMGTAQVIVRERSRGAVWWRVVFAARATATIALVCVLGAIGGIHATIKWLTR